MSVSNVPQVFQYQKAWSLKLTSPKMTGSNDAGGHIPYKPGQTQNCCMHVSLLQTHTLMAQNGKQVLPDLA